MSYFVNKRLRVELDVITYVTRSLPGRGKIAISVGQEVSPPEIIGSSTTAAGFRNFNLSKMLEVSPAEVRRYLQRPIGQRIYKGELLAYKPGGFFKTKKIITAPTDGMLESIEDKTGLLRMSFLPRQRDLPAAVYGIVDKISEERGQIVIKTQATHIFGLFGTGLIRGGILRILGGRGDLISQSQISYDMDEQIVVAGGLIYGDAISFAVSVGINGIITGGINAADYRAMAGGRLIFPRSMGGDIGLSLLVTEGFGSIPIGQDVYDALVKHNGKFAILDGNRAKLLLPSYKSDCIKKIRTTQLPPIYDNLLPEPLVDIEAEELQVGQKVRIIGSPYMGEQGNIVSIDNTSTLLQSGISTILVTVEARIRKIKVPYSNIEIIG